MGQNKARLRVSSHFLVEVVAAEVAKVTGSVALVGNPALFDDLPLECIADLRPGLGPLAGLEAALSSGRGEFNLILACDMPGIQSSHLKQLLNRATQTGALCTLASEANGRKHPLCAVYRSEALALVRAALDARRLRLLDLVEELRAVDVCFETGLINLNTPEQWAAWQSAHLV
jgi:molybdopterin-guanine dinucleotide biosynthesis protein A